MKKRLLVVTCAMVFGSLPASAQSAAEWKGAYIGANVGMALESGHANTTTVFSPTGYFATSSVPEIGGAGAQRVTPKGIAGGIVFGYNLMHRGRLVIGAEADFGGPSTSSSETSAATYPCCAPTSFSITQGLQTDWLFTARPRVGVTVGPLLVFATGGLALTNLKYLATFSDTFATAQEGVTATGDRLGWAVGGGVERPIGGHFSLEAHVLQITFQNISITSTNLTAFSPPIPFPTNIFDHSTDFRMRMIRGGINYRF